MVEHAAVNRVVVGSSPTSGAIYFFPQFSSDEISAGLLGRHCFLLTDAPQMTVRAQEEFPV